MQRIVARHDGDHGIGCGPNGWTCIRHLKTLLFAQLAGLNSLREIEQGLAAQPGGLYHLDLRLPRRSTLSDALTRRPAAVFRDICQSLMAQASRTIRREAGELIQLVDASPIPLRDPHLAWPEADARVRGLKLHIGYDPRAELPDWIEISSPKLSDITVAREMPIRPEATYVMDKAYLDFGWWHRINQAGAFFVTRLKRNTKRRDVRPQPAKGIGILEDNRLKVGHPSPRGGAKNPLADTELREIVVEREGKKPLRLVSNRALQGTLGDRAFVQVAQAESQDQTLSRAQRKCRQNPDLLRSHRLPVAAHAA
jgi:putative transposase